MLGKIPLYLILHKKYYIILIEKDGKYKKKFFGLRSLINIPFFSYIYEKHCSISFFLLLRGEGVSNSPLKIFFNSHLNFEDNVG